MAEQHPHVPHEPSQTGLRWEERLVLSLIVLVVLSGMSWWVISHVWNFRSSGHSRVAVNRDSDSSKYVGDRSCRDCHPGESASHSRSGHSRTFRPAAQTEAARQLDNVSTEDPELPGVTWRYALRDGRFTTERREGGKVETMLIEYAFGSGRHAVTFTTLTGRDPRHPTMLEHRLTVFASRPSWSHSRAVAQGTFER